MCVVTKKNETCVRPVQRERKKERRKTDYELSSASVCGETQSDPLHSNPYTSINSTTMQEDNSCDVSQLPDGLELRQTVNTIRGMAKRGHTISEVRERYSEFCRKYPKFVDKLMDPEMNPEQLSYILSMFDQVQQRNTSYEHASQTIGKSMFDKFIAPDLTPSQLERVHKRMQELQTRSPEELAQAAAQLGQSTVPHSDGNDARGCPLNQSNTGKQKGNKKKGNKKKLRKERASQGGDQAETK